MRPLRIVLVLALGTVAGCAQPTVPSPAANGVRAMTQRPAAASYRILHNFGGDPDGARPQGDLARDPARDGVFYGTTVEGGSSFGTVFEVTVDGKERVLHRFTLHNGDGALPKAGVTVLSNLGGIQGSTLFGTTENGGTAAGTVYELQVVNAKERVLYNFEGRPNGSFPDSSLLFYNGKFYGTACGGSLGRGIAYEVTTDGTGGIVYEFKGTPDGYRPVVGLELLDDKMYGTTRTGGTYNNGCVYEVRPNGKERVLYSFVGGVHDGRFPEAALTEFNGALYGTASGGGPRDDGIAFEVSKDGTERVLHFFGRSGSQPRARLIVMNGKLYGTTEFGGTAGAGTVFELEPKPYGAFRVVHDFTGEEDGRFPRAGLTEYKGALYGTTSSAGAHGFGTVFELTP